MKHLIRGLCAFSLALVLVAGVSADDKKKDVKKEQPKQPAVNPLFTFNKAMKPAATDDQVKKLADLQKEYQPQLADLEKKANAIMTPERKKAADEARKAAAAAGKKGKDLAEAVAAAVKLSDAEQTQMKEIAASRTKLMGEINKKKGDLLTAEQKESLKPKPKKDAK